MKWPTPHISINQSLKNQLTHCATSGLQKVNARKLLKQRKSIKLKIEVKKLGKTKQFLGYV